MGGLTLEPPPAQPRPARGEVVVLREVWRGRTFSERPARVVRDDHQLRVFFLGAGSVWRYAVDRHGTGLRLPVGDWSFAERATRRHVLSFAVPGSWAALLASWDPQTLAFGGWYVNLQTPLRAVPGAYEYTDLFLDVLVSPARDAWEWKDEDELAEALALGLLDEGDAQTARAAGERAVEWLLLRQPPFDEAWEDWRPDPAWLGPPPLPAERVGPAREP